MGVRRGLYRGLVGKPEGKRSLGDQGLDGKIILRWIFRKWDMGHGLDRATSGQGEVAGTCDRGSIKCREFLD